MEFINGGEAAHIAAASGGPGARRVVATMTPEQLTSIENGLWLCGHHHKIIDSDETRFTIPLLQEMKLLAERKAQLRIDRHAFDPARFNLLSYDLEITKLNLREQVVAEAFNDTAIPLIWGQPVSRTIRDFVFEVAQNALNHGGAKRVVLQITPKAITLCDDGTESTPKTWQP